MNLAISNLKCLSRRSRFAAFTLIELLLSIVIFAVVLTAVNGVLYGAMRLRNRTTSMIEQRLPLERAVERIRKDLFGIVRPDGTMSGSFRTGVSTMGVTSQQPGFEFYANTGTVDAVNPWGDIEKISYVLRSPTNQFSFSSGKDLIRLASRNLLPVQQDIPVEDGLLNGVEKLDFEFYDGTQWRTSWDSTTETTVLPQAVRVLLTLTPPLDRSVRATLEAPVQIVVPIMISANTNTTQTANSGQ